MLLKGWNVFKSVKIILCWTIWLTGLSDFFYYPIIGKSDNRIIEIFDNLIIGISDYRIIGISDNRIIRLPDNPIIGSSDYRIIGLPDNPITRIPYYQIIR